MFMKHTHIQLSVIILIYHSQCPVRKDQTNIRTKSCQDRGICSDDKATDLQRITTDKENDFIIEFILNDVIFPHQDLGMLSPIIFNMQENMDGIQS